MLNPRPGSAGVGATNQAAGCFAKVYALHVSGAARLGLWKQRASECGLPNPLQVA